MLYFLCCAFFFSSLCPLSSLITFAFAMQKQQHMNKQTTRNTKHTYNHMFLFFFRGGEGDMSVMCLFVCVVVVLLFVVLCLLCCVLLCFFAMFPILANHLRLCNTTNNNTRTKQQHTKRATNNMLVCYVAGGCYLWVGLIDVFAFLCACFVVCVVVVCVVFVVLCAHRFLCCAPMSSLVTFAFAIQKTTTTTHEQKTTTTSKQ